jgi:hypothetical protein
MSPVFIKSLSARASLEKFFITQNEDEGMEADWAADSCGWSGYRAGIDRSDVPKLLTSNQRLVRGWEYGWDNACLSEDMEHCTTCNDNTGNPCHVHG